MKNMLSRTVHCLLFFLCPMYMHASDKIFYPRSFNPAQGLVNIEEEPYRKEICLNGSWDFMPVYGESASDFTVPSSFKKEAVAIKIPSPWNVNNFTDGKGGDFVAYPSYPKEWEKAKIGWMRKKITIPDSWKDKRIILHFEAVMGKALVYVNGQKASENAELFLPFEVDITPFVEPGRENEILTGVAKASLFDERGKYGRRSYVGGSMWGIEMAGIWQDVYLFAYNPVYVQDIFIKPDVQNKKLKIELDINNTTGQKKVVDVEAEVKKWYNLAGRSIHEAPEQKSELAGQASFVFPKTKKIALPPNATTKITIEKQVAGELEYWTPESPNLYGTVISLKENKTVLDKKYERFGWRQFLISGNKLLLNGKEIRLKGDSWHFMGVPQMTRRYPWAWFNMLKDANANAVRLHAQPFPRFYLDVADEMGICVLDETGIWSSDGGPKIDSEDYWESCVSHLRKLIARDKNHASVFGWSVCNETVPVAVNVFKAPEELVQRQIQEINRWVAIASEMDPTRNWISGDGEEMRPTNLPTLIGHYGGMEGMKKWSAEGKPWGIGEQSMAYYGTPKQASAYNGNRAYESMLGRMEAIATESYELIKTQRELNASYSSIFNIVWYGVQPLDLGLKDPSLPPDADDGIFFGFQEGAYGMQPERIGPYTTTLNPGYDPEIPLYRPWPLFYAIQQANATPLRPYSIDVKNTSETAPAAAPVDAAVLYAASGSKLRESLENLGLKILPDAKATANTLIIIDGNNPPSAVRQETDKIKKAIHAGAKVFIIGMNPQSLNLVNAILPYAVSLEERTATSFLKQGASTIMNGLNHSNFYFSELIPSGGTAINYGMSGDFVLKANILLRACNTDWQRWNYRPETSKTGNVFRSEREKKNSDVVMASIRSGNSEIILSTLDFIAADLQAQPLLSQMLTNIGATLSSDHIREMNALDDRMQLRRTLVLELSGKNRQTTGELLATDFLEGESTVNPQLNTVSAKKEWKVIASDENGMFAYSKPQRDQNGGPVAYLSFWIYSPRSLSNLLAEPDMPNLDLYLGTKGGFAVYLNETKMISQENREEKEIKIPNVLLNKGWNHLLIKLVDEKQQTQLKASVRFESTDKNYTKQILSSVAR